MIDFVIPLADWVNSMFEVVNYYVSPVMRSVSAFLEVIIRNMESALLWLPESVVILVVGLIVWRPIRDFGISK